MKRRRAALVAFGSGSKNVSSRGYCSSCRPIAANVALSFPEAYGINVNLLIATGLVLFLITLVVNSIARYIVNRRKEFSGAN